MLLLFVCLFFDILFIILEAFQMCTQRDTILCCVEKVECKSEIISSNHTMFNEFYICKMICVVCLIQTFLHDFIFCIFNNCVFFFRVMVIKQKSRSVSIKSKTRLSRVIVNMRRRNCRNVWRN
jgi:hypothetical protein